MEQWLRGIAGVGLWAAIKAIAQLCHWDTQTHEWTKESCDRKPWQLHVLRQHSWCFKQHVQQSYSVFKLPLFGQTLRQTLRLTVSTKQILCSTTVFNIDNNQKCFLSSKSAYYYDFWRSCDTKDWSNDAENTAFITEINYSLTHIHIKTADLVCSNIL